MRDLELTPMLTVRDGRTAVDFYKRAFGANELSRQTTPTGQLIVEFSIGEERFFAVEENPAAFNQSPETLGGTSVRLSVVVADPTTGRILTIVSPATTARLYSMSSWATSQSLF